MESTIAPFSSPLFIMAKPAGATCNLACDYAITWRKQIYTRKQATI